MWKRSEVRGQRSEVRGQRSEVRGQRSEARGQRPEARGRRSERKKGKSGGFIGFSELGAGCSKDGLGQDVPATVKMRARCPRTLFESGFISNLGLSTLDLRLFIFRISAFQLSAFTPRGGTNTGTGRKIPKKVSVPAYPAFACALKTRKMRRFKVQVGIRQKTWRQKKLEKRKRS
jgi:hypothetical protein